MEQIKELTKRLIANSFKELLQQNSFEKITIKMITDHANVIRPTFYNHFHDKYELIEWILKDEILDEARRLEETNHNGDGIKHIVFQFFNDRNYYKKVFEITGQNGFEETLSTLVSNAFTELASENSKLVKELSSPIGFVGKYYASGMIAVIKTVLNCEDEAGVLALLKDYEFLMSRTIYDVLD